MNLYLEHFGLREPPFKITPATDFFYGGGRRGETLDALLYAINAGEGIMMLTGEVGSGKTMLLRTLADKVMEKMEVVYIPNPSLSGREILYNICEELGLAIDVQRPDAVRRLQEYLVEKHSQGRHVVAFIDEAQAMPDASLEEVRLLSNLETGRHKLMQMLLFGQPELLEKLGQQNMRQLRDRITVSLSLNPFNRSDVQAYISKRLHAAGYSGEPIFSPESCQMIATASQGLSRRINVLADKALLSAYERSALRVMPKDVQRAVQGASYSRMRYRSPTHRRLQKIAVGGLATAAVVAVFAVGVILVSALLPDSPPQPPNLSQDVASTAAADTATAVTETLSITPTAPAAATSEDIAARAQADTQAYVDAVVADVYSTLSASPDTAGLSFDELLNLQKLPPSEQLEAAVQASRQAEERAARAAQQTAEQQAAKAETRAEAARIAAEEAVLAAQTARNAADAISRRIIAEEEAIKLAARRAKEAEAARLAAIAKDKRKKADAIKLAARRAKEAEAARIAAIARDKRKKADAIKLAARRAKEAKAAKVAAAQKALAQAKTKTAGKINSIIRQSPSAAADSALPPADNIQPTGLSPIIAVQSSGEQAPSPNSIVPAEDPAVALKAVTKTPTGLADNPQWNWLPPNSYLRKRLLATHTWLANKRGSSAWTSRLMSVGQVRGGFLEKFLRNFSNSYPLRNVMVYPTRVKGVDYFVVTFGVYSNRNSADVYINSLPTALIKGRPFAQKISDAANQARKFWRSIQKQ